MSRAMLTGLLIALSVIARCYSAPAEFNLLDKTELKEPEKIQKLNKELKIGMCWLCVRTINQVMSLARHEIGKEIKAMCKKFKHFEQSCRHQGFHYEDMAIHLLFHGNTARESCIHMHMC